MCKNSEKCKKQYFNNLNPKSTTDTKKLWKAVKNFWTTEKTFFSNNSKTANTFISHENHRTIKDSKKISHTLEKCFTNLAKTQN